MNDGWLDEPWKAGVVSSTFRGYCCSQMLLNSSAFRDVINFCKTPICTRTPFDLSNKYRSFRSERNISILENKCGSYFLKENQGKRYRIRDGFVLKDQLAYLISHRFGWDVVPETIVLSRELKIDSMEIPEWIGRD